MERDRQIESILELNNKIIKTKSNDPNNYLRIKFDRFKLAKVIRNTLHTALLENQISGPSIPEM